MRLARTRSLITSNYVTSLQVVSQLRNVLSKSNLGLVFQTIEGKT